MLSRALRSNPSLAALVAVLVACGGALLIAGSTADAASASVTVGSPENRFAPNIVTINAGDTVTFQWAAGTHEVDFEGVTPEFDIDAENPTGTTNAFTTPGTYYYYCGIHATDDLATEQHVQANDAMVGKVVVLAASTATSTATTPSGSPAATATTTPPAPGAPSTGSGLSGDGGLDVLAWLGWSLLAAAALSAGLLAWKAGRPR